MIAIIVIMAIVIIALSWMLAARIRNEQNITRQLKQLRNEDTNSLVHSDGMSRSLIIEINELLKDKRSSYVEFKKKNHDIEQMITNISHDLRTPLTSAMGYIGLINNPDLAEEERIRSISIVEKRLNRLEELINSFFEFSGIISSGNVSDTSEMNIIGVLEESVVNYFDDYTARGREIRINQNASSIKVVSNRNMLMRIFDNLINNALKHGSGTLTIDVVKGEDVVLKFSNYLSEQNIDTDKIFDEFYTTDISRTKGNTGLGLAIAKQFTNMLGGNISAEFDGETFAIIISFPCIK